METKEINRNQYSVLGVMSGTSLDGVDLAFCSFEKKRGKWSYSIIQAETISYPGSWKTRLSSLENESAYIFARTDVDYGYFLGKVCRDFLAKYSLKPDFISSHGHTIFHEPDKGMTFQVGRGSCIAADTGLTVINDFRTLDVALGGQGAPLVPIGDKLLFPEYEYCLNLGGFANISFARETTRIAFDICPANIVLNHLAQKSGLDFDQDGHFASTGNINPDLLISLGKLPFYRKEPPKSLGKEWVLSEFYPLLEASGVSLQDQLRTVCEHISIQISQVVFPESKKKILVTGGGALNRFLMQKIKEKLNLNVVVPDLLTVCYKEALIFAFLGVLRWRNEPNCLSSVTGATKDNSGGCIYSG